MENYSEVYIFKEKECDWFLYQQNKRKCSEGFLFYFIFFLKENIYKLEYIRGEHF